MEYIVHVTKSNFFYIGINPDTKIDHFYSFSLLTIQISSSLSLSLYIWKYSIKQYTQLILSINLFLFFTTVIVAECQSRSFVNI